MKTSTAKVAPWLARLALIASTSFVVTSANAVSLDPQLLPAIQAATFEVVSAKPETDPLTYAKPLPLDLLPYQERTDKYYSIGTAFAIGGGRYVTAAHVLLAGVNSLWGMPALRDNAGNVYVIDKVQKFSLERDFAVFTLEKQPGTAALAIDAHPTAGQVVYTVGNAYGTGVVIRDGLYTSDTPEQQDGRWKWQRFSAAASPGNSGGPLVDQQGKAIGIVLAKSPNENLNYALPLDIVQQAPDGVAEIDVRAGYQFDVFDTTISNTLKASFKLPMQLGDFFAAYQQRTNGYFDGQLKDLLDKEPQRLFPNGAGSSDLLHSIANMADFPKVIARDDSGNWGLGGSAKDDIKLSGNGYVTPGEFGKNLLFHLRKPDDVSADKLYGNASEPMDLLLKSGFLKRTVGTESVAVTSLGKPILDAVHTDAWGRRWQVWEWPIPYANSLIVMLALPVPDGYVGIARYSTAIQEHDQLINTKALADFMYVNYDGTLAQWKDFLRHDNILPQALKGSRIDFDYGRKFRYASSRMEFSFTPALQSIQPDSVMTLGFSFFGDHGKPVWDIGELWLSAKADGNNYVMLVRSQAPSVNENDDYRHDWEKIRNRKHPYDAVSRDGDDTTKITTVANPPSASGDPGVLYTVNYTVEGKQPQDAMKAKLDLLLQSVRVSEQ